MAEVVAIAGITFTLPAILSAVGQTLQAAYSIYGQVDLRRTQLRILLDRCSDLVRKVAEDLSAVSEKSVSPRILQNISELEVICEHLKSTVETLSRRSFLWCMLHQDTIDAQIGSIEGKITDTFALFNFAAHVDQNRFMLETKDAREKDRDALVARLDLLSTDDRRILSALQDQEGAQRRIEELLVAVLKRVGELGPEQTPEAGFLRHANIVLQRVSKGSAQNIPYISEDWVISSLEVDIEDTNLIGQGSFGRVFKGSWKAAHVAVKQMYVEDSRTLSDTDRKAMYREVRLWSQLHHPNIVNLYGACLEATYPFLVMQYCSFGNLNSYLASYPQSNRLDLTYNIVAGMTYLHGKDVIHGDLKSFNILVDDKKTALIADFGLSSVIDGLQSRSSQSTRATERGNAGTMRWMAPECLDGERSSKASDIYGLAMVIWEMYSGEIPFTDVAERALLNVVVDRQRRPPRPIRLSSDLLWNLVERCWAPLSASRPDVREIQASLLSYDTRASLQDGEKEIWPIGAPLAIASAPAVGSPLGPAPLPSNQATRSTSSARNIRIIGPASADEAPQPSIRTIGSASPDQTTGPEPGPVGTSLRPVREPSPSSKRLSARLSAAFSNIIKRSE